MNKKLGFTSSTTLFESALSKSEKNDCVVRAIAAATGSDYDTAHAFCATELKRQPNKGVYGFITKVDILNVILDCKVSKVGEPLPYMPGRIDLFTVYKCRGRDIYRDMTVKTFAERYAEGCFVVVVKGHAFCLKDGVVVGGNVEDAVKLRRRISGAFKFEK